MEEVTFASIIPLNILHPGDQIGIKHDLYNHQREVRIIFVLRHN